MAIFGILNYIILKKQRIMGVLESIKVFHENRDRHTCKRSLKGCAATIDNA